MRISLSLCALLASAGLAFAADQATRATPNFTLEVAPEWTGSYVGGTLGWSGAAGDQKLTSGSYQLPTSGFISTPSLTDNASATNALTGNNVFMPGAKLKGGDALEFGLFGGYQHQVSSVVMGLEGDFNYGRQNAKARDGGQLDIFGAYTHPSCATCLGDTASADGALSGAVRSNMLWNSSLRLRAGVLATQQMLVFATGGVTVGAFERSLAATGSTVFSDDATPGVAQATHTFSAAKKSSHLRLGWTLGVGVDYRIAAGWNVRAEYRYADFGASDMRANVTTACTETVTGACAKLTTGAGSVAARFTDASHAVRVGLSYQFSSNAVAILARY